MISLDLTQDIVSFVAHIVWFLRITEDIGWTAAKQTIKKAQQNVGLFDSIKNVGGLRYQLSPG